MCPKCNSGNIVPIEYGMPGEELRILHMEGKVHLGGCVIDGEMFDIHCNDCEHQWFKTDNINKEVKC